MKFLNNYILILAFLIIFLIVLIITCYNLWISNGDLEQELSQTKEKLFNIQRSYDDLCEIVFRKNLRDLANVPADIILDKRQLPHKIIDGNDIYTVYIAEYGQKYHRTKGCSKANKAVNLLELADVWKPCLKCVGASMDKLRVSKCYEDNLCLVKLKRQYLLKTGNLDLLIPDWDFIIHLLPSSVIPSYKNSQLKTNGKDILYVIFNDLISYTIGNRKSIINILEEIIKTEYQIQVHVSCILNDTDNTEDVSHVLNETYNELE